MSDETARPASVVGLECRISEPARYGRGVEPLVQAIAGRVDTEPRIIGTLGDDEAKHGWRDDLKENRGCLLEAGGQVDDALTGGQFPIVVHGDCSIAMTTLPTVARHREDAKVLWLDAHGDFNTPDTTSSGWLGGMGLAGACGKWDTGLGLDPFPPDRVVLCGARDLESGERDLLERSGVTVIGPSLETLVFLQNALDGAPVYIHLDPDVLDPSVFPAEMPADGGITAEKLYDLLDATAEACDVIGVEIASFWAPEDRSELMGAAELIADSLIPLLSQAGVT